MGRLSIPRLGRGVALALALVIAVEQEGEALVVRADSRAHGRAARRSRRTRWCAPDAIWPARRRGSGWMVASASRQRRGEVERQLSRVAGEARRGSAGVTSSCVSRVAPGCHSTSPPSPCRDRTRGDEQMIRQPVEIGQRVRIDALSLRASATAARSARRTTPRARWSAATAADPPGRMKLVSGASAAFIASISSSSRVDLRARRCAAHVVARNRSPRRGDVGAEVEHLVLDRGAASSRELAVVERGDRHADRAIGLVDLADRRPSRGWPWTRATPSTSPALPPSPVRV